MDYEKYKQALKRAKELLENMDKKDYFASKADIENIFPELKDNDDDERNIKDLIDELRCSLRGANSQNDACGGGHEKRIALLEWAITWLEKQSNKSVNIDVESMVSSYKQRVVNQYNGVRNNPLVNMCVTAFRHGVENVLEELNLKKLEKQGEQEHADNFEPKFKAGDWIVFNGLTLHIDEVVNGYYRTTSRGDGIHNSYDWDIDNAARLWTIQEAKDGTVLIKEETGEPFIYNGNRGTYLPEFVGAYCGIRNEEFIPNGSSYYWGRPTCPATKEQRDSLFAKMKEAGYKWDSENKELKKIGVKTLDADKVIEWLKDTINETTEECGIYHIVRLTLPYNSIEVLINDFKEDFGL